MSYENNEKNINRTEAGDSKFVKIDEVRMGRIDAVKWMNKNGISYSLSIGYKKNGQWQNKKISILNSEMESVIDALRNIYEKKENTNGVMK